MKVRYIEGHGNDFNWGKWMLCRWDGEDWAVKSNLPGLYRGAYSLIASQGWAETHVWVMDLATGEGALFQLGGYAAADLNRHRIHVCVLFEAFLTWLYQHYRAGRNDWWDSLPKVVDLPDAEQDFHGHRRPGYHIETGRLAIEFSHPG